MRAAREKAVMDGQTTIEAVAAKEAAENKVVSSGEELQRVKTSHEQALLALTREISSLDV